MELGYEVSQKDKPYMSSLSFTVTMKIHLWPSDIPLKYHSSKTLMESSWNSPVKVSRDKTSPCASSQSTPKDLAALSIHMVFDLTLDILHCISKSKTWEKYKVCASEKLCETRS